MFSIPSQRVESGFPYLDYTTTMVRAHQLTKRYAGKTAVDGISFEILPGEVVGFLGPNGAGKTSTIRMLTGYLAPSSGGATVSGFDVFRESRKARSCIGYMPENVPLYDDMRVKEYLRFRARLQGLWGKKMRIKVGSTMEICGLVDVRRKMIKGLSKGYRQRVGLADALVHEPDLLILDEPTNGLDPNQIRAVRDLIKNLSEKHTILISTHLLAEVEKTCDRVIILDEGKIRAKGSPQELISQLRTAGHLSLDIKSTLDTVEPILLSIDGVKKIIKSNQKGEWLRLEILADSGKDVREGIATALLGKNIHIRELIRHQPSLEDAFVELTMEPEPGER